LIHDDVRAGRNRIVGDHFAMFIRNDDLRVQIFLMFDDDHGFLLGRLVHFLFHRHAFDDVVEFNLTGLLGENGHVIRIPLHEGFAFLDLAAVGHGNDRADDDGVVFRFATVIVQDGNGAVFVENDAVAVLERDDAEFVVTNLAVVLGLDLWNFEDL